MVLVGSLVACASESGILETSRCQRDAHGLSLLDRIKRHPDACDGHRCEDGDS
jgi:hypothetical protein